MGILGDTINEFKGAKTSEKVFIIGGAAAAIAIALYIHNQNTGSSSGTPAQGATGATGSGGAASLTPNAPGNPYVGLPYGTTVGTDTSGNPVYTINPPPPSSTTTTGTTTTGTTTPKPSTHVNPLIPYGTYKGPSYSNLAPNTHYNYNGTNYLLNTGPSGKLYGTNNGKQVLLYAPKSFYAGQGGGPYGTNVSSRLGGRIAGTKNVRQQPTIATKNMAMRNR